MTTCAPARAAHLSRTTGAPLVTAPLVTAPLVTAPLVTAPLVTAPRGTMLLVTALLFVAACSEQNRAPRPGSRVGAQRVEGATGVSGADSVAEEPEDPNDPDKDEIVGTSDLCATLAEDCDGFHDEDGCPDRDDDADGIPDICDACPRAPESWNGVHDDDGCTDAVDARRSDQPSFSLLLPTSLAAIARARVVDEWARALRDAPHITRVDVIGDAAPSEPDGAQLAEQRAQAAAAALIARGIAATRLRPVGRAPRAESRRTSGLVLGVTMASRARVSLAVVEIGGHDIAPHEPLGDDTQSGWAPEPMSCPDGRAVPAEPRDGSVRTRGAACRARLLAPTLVRSYTPGLLLTEPVPAATDACAALVRSEYPWALEDALDGVDASARCPITYGVAVASRHRRGVAVLEIRLPDVMSPTWLALSNETGFATFHRIDDFQTTSLSSPQFTVDTLAFRADESELLVEWRALDHGGEGVDSDEWEFVTEREGTTLCRWASAAADASVRCQTIDRRRASDDTRWRNERLVSRRRRESRVDVLVAEGGALEVRALRASPPGELRPTLGSYAWGAWPALPEVRFP